MIPRRVDRAAALLRIGNLPISQVALEVGFCHQSHPAMHIWPILGLAPREVKDAAFHCLIEEGGPVRRIIRL